MLGSDTTLTQGSPPRVRGKEGESGENVGDFRITPARAGKSRRGRNQWQHHRDHPRACGEKCLVVVFLVLVLGSPPRVRGKAWQPVLLQRQPGITPARAGKSGYIAVVVLARRDHPRACGEKPYFQVWKMSSPGSPPRVRGKGA